MTLLLFSPLPACVPAGMQRSGPAPPTQPCHNPWPLSCQTSSSYRQNPNGCNVPATWFALKNKTNCTLVQWLVKDNHGGWGHTTSVSVGGMRMHPGSVGGASD